MAQQTYSLFLGLCCQRMMILFILYVALPARLLQSHPNFHPSSNHRDTGEHSQSPVDREAQRLLLNISVPLCVAVPLWSQLHLTPFPITQHCPGIQHQSKQEDNTYLWRNIRERASF